MPLITQYHGDAMASIGTAQSRLHLLLYGSCGLIGLQAGGFAFFRPAATTKSQTERARWYDLLMG
jgi:hypothetical protein